MCLWLWLWLCERADFARSENLRLQGCCSLNVKASQLQLIISLYSADQPRIGKTCNILLLLTMAGQIWKAIDLSMYTGINLTTASIKRLFQTWYRNQMQIKYIFTVGSDMANLKFDGLLEVSTRRVALCRCLSTYQQYSELEVP